MDTTGAGDAFVAGILSQLARDLSLLQVTCFVLSSLKLDVAKKFCGELVRDLIVIQNFYVH